MQHGRDSATAKMCGNSTALQVNLFCSAQTCHSQAHAKDITDNACAMISSQNGASAHKMETAYRNLPTLTKKAHTARASRWQTKRTCLTKKANASRLKSAAWQTQGCLPDKECKRYQSQVGEQQKKEAEAKAVLPYKVELEGICCSKGQ